MNAPVAASIVGILGALLLVGGALTGRRLGTRRLLRLALVWAAIIVAVWAAVTIGGRVHPL